MCKIGTIKHLKASVLSSLQLWLLDNFVNFFASRPCNCLLLIFTIYTPDSTVRKCGLKCTSVWWKHDWAALKRGWWTSLLESHSSSLVSQTFFTSASLRAPKFRSLYCLQLQLRPKECDGTCSRSDGRAATDEGRAGTTALPLVPLVPLLPAATILLLFDVGLLDVIDLFLDPSKFPSHFEYLLAYFPRLDFISLGGISFEPETIFVISISCLLLTSQA